MKLCAFDVEVDDGVDVYGVDVGVYVVVVWRRYVMSKLTLILKDYRVDFIILVDVEVDFFVDVDVDFFCRC